MIPNKQEDSDKSNSTMEKGFSKSLRLFFGILMVAVFGFVGLMLLFNWFDVIYDPRWTWFRWVGGPIFILYGFFRAYRLYRYGFSFRIVSRSEVTESDDE